MGLNIDERKLLDKASEDEIEIAFELLIQNLNKSSFLADTNFLKYSATKTIGKQFEKKPRKRKKHLSKNTVEYIAASALQHNIDSWNYFGHAISCLLRGDDLTSRHMFYYSELRSAMSFLATQGIGIFNDRHISVVKNSKAKLINEKIQPTIPGRRVNENKQPTHSFTWDTFDYYLNNDIKLTRIFDKYHVENISINNWLSSFGINQSMRTSIVKEFIKKLSFDLNHFSKDRDARNEASYRPSCMESIPTYDISENLKDIKELWEFSKPNNIKGEIIFDLILLAEILQLAFQKSHPYEFSHLRAKKQFRHKLILMFNTFGLSESRKNELIEFFCIDRKALYNHLSLTDISSPQFKKGMLYRGFIFARLSNVFCNRLLKSSPSIDKFSLQFWWSPIGRFLGLWENLQEPEEFSDLWQDLEDIISTLNPESQPAGSSTKSFWVSNSETGFILSTCPRIGFWGLGI